jgi:hypothetical protein
MSRDSIGPHPQPGNAFSIWFDRLERILSGFNRCDILSPEFSYIVAGVSRLSEEVIYELTSSSNRSGSVYDRTDYVVRELLRTSTLPNLLDWCAQIAAKLREGTLLLTREGFLKNGEEQVPAEIAQALIVLIPTMLKLCFTAQETVGVINIDELLKFVADTIQAAEGNMELAIPRNENQKTIFEVAPVVTTACITHMKILNTSLFFTQFRQKRLFEAFVKLAVRANELEKEVLLGATIECLNAYIQVSQSEGDRKECQKNPEFIGLYRKMMEQIVDPQLKAKSENRSKFRSILFYSRSLKG